MFHGNYKITSGEIINVDSTNYECVINKELAEENSLTVGSKVTFVNPNKTDETYEFTVKGIFEDTSKSSEATNVFSDSGNKIIVSKLVVDSIITKSSTNESTKLTANITPTIVLKDYNSIEPFRAEVTAKGLPKNYTVVTNEESVLASIKPIENLNQFSNMFLVIVLAIGAVILVIINMINIRERKYEIGVLRAIGMKKGNVLIQFVLELFIVTIISIIIGTFIGGIISVPTANYMLKNQIDSLQATSNNINSNFGPSFSGKIQNIGGGMFGGMLGTNGNVSYIEQINATLNIEVMIKILVIGIALTIISSLISMIIISRYNPLKILSNRS